MQSFDQVQDSDIAIDDNFDNDDLVTFQHDSKLINLYYSQLTKYSKLIRDSYLFSDVINRFPQEIHKFQEEFQLLPESIDYFFQLLQQNYNVNDFSNLTYINCIDLLKISKFLEVRKLSFEINQYIKSHSIDVDFVVQMIQHDVKTQTNNQQIGISKEIEQLLTSKINECLLNDKFGQLPIEIIYRIIEKSSPKMINNNKLFDIIIKSLSKFCVLFQFLDLQKISEDRLDDLCEMYSNSDENTRQYFNYLKCNLILIREISKRKKNLEETNDEQKNKMNDLESKIESLQKNFNDSEKIIDQLKIQLNDSKKLNNEQQDETNELKTKVTSLQKQFNDSEIINNQLKIQLNDTKELNTTQQNKMKELENQVSQLQKRLIGIFLIKGKISAKVENGLLISAEINLTPNEYTTLDTSKSKFIISTSGEKSLGSEAYEKGEPITSLQMKTPSYLCKPGKFYVRCIVFSSSGESNEIVSNLVTTNGSCVTFGYEGKAAKILLYQGKYKLEVWGAKGGDSTGNSENYGSWNRWKQSSVQGGLGGYSQGILNLNENETFYVYVGGEGRTSDSSDGSVTEGDFPDGGGTKTGHSCSYTTVPGTGGGSTSIRIGNDSNYSRVIVAGGGGGASGCRAFVDPGGFGGGLEGGNCSFQSKLQSQGAGTQTGSTRGLGNCDGRHGDPGKFGLGSTGKYEKRCDSGGGGGGGWYGGGSGGYGNSVYCSSGGGGSGWTFTETSYRTWESGDTYNASKFALNSSYYLTDTICLGGNEEFPRPDGNGKERGHTGNGYAKITPL